ncbi:MAG: hypothetical protein ABL999_19225 [Pyrinomonadaceae bacterium]
MKLMLFRPNFCANCGEKIERPEWFPWTSRRFCSVCEIEFKGQELLPKVVVVLSLLVGTFGIGAYLKSGTPESDLQASRQPKKAYEQPAPIAKMPATNVSAPLPPTGSAFNGQPEQHSFSSTTGTRPPAQQNKPKIETDEPVNFCGAETKKGTPCSRRVKGNTRCYQHIGMPAMAVSEKPDVRSQR